MPSAFPALSTLSQQAFRLASPKRTTFIVLTVLGLLAIMAWMQVKEQEQYLIQRNIRLLNLWGNDISKKIESYETVLETTLTGAMAHLGHRAHHSHITFKPDEKDRERWIRTSSAEAPKSDIPLSMLLKFSLNCPNELAPPILGQEKAIERDLFREFNRLCEAEGLEEVDITELEKASINNQTRLKILERQFPPKIQLTHVKSDIASEAPLEENSQSQPQTASQKDRQGSSSFLDVTVSKNESQTSAQPFLGFKFTSTINLQLFLDRLWNKQIFDEILLFEGQEAGSDKSQRLIYHLGTNSMTLQSFEELKEYRARETVWDSLFTSKEQSTGEGNTLKQDKPFGVSVPGQDFQVFVRPIQLPKFGQQWILVGLVQQEKFVNNSLAISSNFLLVMMCILLALLLAIPLIHLKTMGPKDPLRSFHVLGLVLSALLGAGFITFLILDISVYFHGTRELNDRMRESAQSIKDEMFGELKSVLTTLRAFDRSTNLQNDCASLVNTTSTEKPSDICISATNDTARTTSKETLPVGQRAVLLEENMDLKNHTTSPQVEKSSGLYQDFLYAFWMDPDGSLRINWARDKFEGTSVQGMTQNFPLYQRQYVQTVLDKPTRLSQFPDEPNLPPFYLEPITSLTTGLNTVVASMKSRLEYPKKDNWVAAIEFKFRSLMDRVVLPPGIGFAVIDNVDHQVLLHSEDWRNLREPFIVETDHNTMLRDLLLAKTAGHAEGSYWGKPHSFYLLPLDPIPWSLVVFRDRELLRSVNLVGLLVTGFFYSLWAFSIYVALWIFLHWQKAQRAPWLWPDKAKRPIFAKLCVANMGVFTLQTICIIGFWDYPKWQLMGAWLVPFLWIVCSLGWFLTQQSKNSSEENEKRSKNENWFFQWPYPQSYSLMLTSFLLILGVAPAFGCFSAVFNQEMKLFTQYQLLQLVQTFHDSPEYKPLIQNLNDSCFSNIKTPPSSDKFPRGVYPKFYSKITASCNSVPKADWHEQLNKSRDRTTFQIAFGLVSQPFVPLLKHASLLGFTTDTWPDHSTKEQQTPISPFPWQSDVQKNQETSPSPLLWQLDGQKVTLKYSIEQDKNSDSASFENLSISADLPFIPWFFRAALPTFENFSGGTIVAYLMLGSVFMLGLYFYLYQIPKFIADRVLFLSYNTPAPFMPLSLFAGTAKERKHNRFVLGFPGQGKTSLALENYKEHNQPHAEETEAPAEPTKKTRQSPRVHEGNPPTAPPYFDLNAFPPEKWKEELSKQISDLRIEDDQDFHVIIDHLEHQWKDPGVNLKKLELMEWLLNRSNHKKGTSKSSPDKDSSESSQNSKLGDLVIQILTKIVSQEKS